MYRQKKINGKNEKGKEDESQEKGDRGETKHGEGLE